MDIDHATSNSLFTDYWARVDEVIGADVTARTTALLTNVSAPANWDPVANVRRLYRSLDGPAWTSPVSPSESNWVWRPTSAYDPLKSHEVRLERAVVRHGGAKNWTYQMATASGHCGPHADTRRSIDLVVRQANASFRFIELKINSDHPLYAAFEILGYGLAYYHARRELYDSRADVPEIMRAQRIALEVLAPDDWYRHRTLANGFELRWLADGLNAGLASLLADSGLEMTFSFESFPHPAPDATAWTKAHYDAAALSIINAHAE